MIEQAARVVKTAPGYAWLEAESGSACGQCSSKAGCGQSALTKLFRPRATLLKVRTGQLPLHGGDRVLIGISERVVLFSALILYLVPLFFLLAFAIAGYQLVVSLQPGAGLASTANLVSILSGAAGFYLGFRFARRRAQRLTAAPETAPVILRRL